MADDFIIIAHRGASGDYPENTLLAFQKALAAGANWLELDVHLSADGELMVIHDRTLQRTSDGRGKVDEWNCADLQRLDAGQGEKIPRLSEVLDLAVGRAVVNIELKGKGVGAPVAKLLGQRIADSQQAAEEFLASSLYEEELILFAEQLPQVRVAPVADHPDASTWELAERLGAWSVHVAKAAVDQRLIATAKQQNRKLLAYTVNAADEVQRLRELGVAGVFSDYPQRFIGQQKESFHGR